MGDKKGLKELGENFWHSSEEQDRGEDANKERKTGTTDKGKDKTKRNEVATKTTSDGNQSQHQEHSQPNAFQERVQTDIMRIKFLKEENKRVKSLDEQIKKLQDELGKKEVRIIQLLEEKDNSLYAIDHVTLYVGLDLVQNISHSSSASYESVREVGSASTLRSTMGDKTTLQKLGDEFCTAVREKIQSKYTDIQERLDNLMKLIQKKKDSTAITTELDRIEKALKDKNEFNPTIRECEKKIRNFWDVNKGKKTGTAEKGNIDPQKQGHGSGKTESKQLRSSQSDTDLSISGKAMAQTQETGNSDAVDNITSFFEQLVWTLHDLLKNNNIMDESKAKLPSVPAVSDKELEKKLKSIHAKVEETTKLCIGKNREVNQASEFLNELYKKATHVDEGHVTDHVKNKGSKPPNLSEDMRKNRVQGHSPVPAKHESGEVSNLDEKLARILSTWKKMEDIKEDVELASRLFADLRKVAKTTSTDIKYDSEGRLNDQSAERENKGALGTGKGDATSPSRIDRSQTFQRDFELVKTALIQKKDTQRLMPAVKEEKNQQHHQSADRKKLEEEVKSLRMRLSELAGAKLYKDNPDIADLSDPNRPTKLRESYCEIYSNEWMDAYQKLSESKSKRSEANVIKYLLDILLEGFAYCTHIKALQRDGLQEVILYPARDYGKSQVKKDNVEMNDIFGRHLAEVLKLSGDMTGEHVATAFLWNKDMSDKFGEDFKKSEKYITKCVKLCWLMQVQTPPVCIDLSAKPGDTFDNETYKEYTKRGKKIDFIVWPPLRRNEGGLLIEKGVAQGK